ncbi:hypothetical protein DZF91_04255 [Actinomadura logoneensis]|uniref:Uncharacterized protein n=2 Tax=Actinomadura logoneensis TaxID=2293572 RepID=A0A372JS78_9ACTN|nr:hypothetical protein DZF91_04255 [Actinomadura logoneensis]
MAGLRVQWRPVGGGTTRYLRISVVGATPVGVQADYLNGVWHYVWHMDDGETVSIGPVDDLTGAVSAIKYVLHRRVM